MSAHHNPGPHRILITGGCGFIGSNLLAYLAKLPSVAVLNIDKLSYVSANSSWATKSESPTYRFLQADICDSAAIDQAINEFCPDTVLHLAAESHVDRSIDGPMAFVTANVVGTASLLESTRKYFDRLADSERSNFRFIYTSTDEVFGSIPGDEYATEAHRFSPSSPYAASKASGDCLVESWQSTFALPCCTLRLSNVYGPYQFPEKLIPVSIIRMLRAQPLALYGAGDHQRDWLYVADAVAGIAEVLARGQAGQVYQFATGTQVENRELLRLLCQIIDAQLQSGKIAIPLGADFVRSFELVQRVDDRPGHDARYAMSTDVVEREFDWEPKTTLDFGLTETVDWYLENRSWWESILETRYDLTRLGSPRKRDAKETRPAER